MNDVLMLVCEASRACPTRWRPSGPSPRCRPVWSTCCATPSLMPPARRDKIARILKPVCTAPTEEAALERFAEFADAWGKKYPAVVRLRENAWEEFTPILRFDTEIRRIVCTTNAIESVNARIRRAVKARGHFPNETAALKCVYMAIMSLDPTGKGQARWTMRWKTALNAFDITFDGRLSAARQQPQPLWIHRSFDRPRRSFRDRLRLFRLMPRIVSDIQHLIDPDESREQPDPEEELVDLWDPISGVIPGGVNYAADGR
ncbi:transposase [Streptomyces sp. NPDC048483]|uniref:transposase n=1 Tax=Streptomyces sp. NPDC048483 TaxID=3154927 RepID=UPI00342A85FC